MQIKTDKELHDLAILEATTADKTEIVRTATGMIGELIFKKYMTDTETDTVELVTYMTLVITYDDNNNSDSITKTMNDIDLKYAY